MNKANSPKNNTLYFFGPFHLDADERLLYRGETSIPLTAKSFDLLLTLLSSAGHLQSREELIAALWPNTIVEESNLTWNVNALRKALGDDRRETHYIETVRGHGYRFVAPVETRIPEPAASPAPPDPAEGANNSQRPKRPMHLKYPAIGLAILCAAAMAGTSFRHFAIRRHAPDKPALPRSIAVLPFENLSPSKANAFFSGGMQATILTKLSSIGELRVISRAATQQYASRPRNLREVARELGVSSVLEGSVQKDGNQVLINVQLIDARTDNHIWAHSYTRTLNNVFDVENDVAEQVATALKARLLPAEKAGMNSTPAQKAVSR
jgi:TolB-like protein/DNA-binding winged helix-turn-helix (wHTH) protein